MKKLLILLLLTCSPFHLLSSFLATSTVQAQGIPFIRNYKSTEYNAHNQNFDIITSEDGTVYVANFEGLLYYDQAQWRVIHTSGITRVTSVFRDSQKRIWAGGYNYLGFVQPNAKGQLELRTLDESTKIKGEVILIWEQHGKVSFLLGDGNIYDIINNKVVLNKHGKAPDQGNVLFDKELHVTQIEQIDDNLQAAATNGNGVIILNRNGEELFRITEANGLCSDNVSHIAYNGRGMLWGATDNGIFCIAVPSIYTHFTVREGLRGSVLSLAESGKTIYAGTLNGLFCQQGTRFVQVGHVTYGCWALDHVGSDLLAATTNGVYRISGQQATQLTTASTTAVKAVEGGFLAGEIDGLYLHTFQGGHQKICNAEKVVKILKDHNGTFWLQNLYGRIWKGDGKTFDTYATGQTDEPATLVTQGSQVTPVTINATKPFTYPLFNYADNNGVTWLTNNKGKDLYAFQNGARQESFSQLVYPLMDYSVRAMYRNKQLIWMGGDRGLTVIDCSRKDAIAQTKPRLYFRSAVLHGDSVLWGGYGDVPSQLPELTSGEQHLIISYSVDYSSILLPTQYRTRINNGKWSAWETETSEEFYNQQYGDYLFEVQSLDAYGNISDPIAIRFSIARPFYLRWYMLLLYVVLAAILVYLVIQWRLRRLEREKHRLEKLVKERTDEVVKLEKVATVAKLTQGLIDRILNPLNYINNFAKLSEGLVKDVKENVEDEKENMAPDNYEDTIDVLDMLKGNLEKVGEHGANTTRTLKAMEEMLKDRSGGIVPMDLLPVIRQDEEMLNNYYANDIKQYGIKVTFNLPKESIPVSGNAEQLSKTFMSLLGNSVYAVVKKAQREKYTPEVMVSVNVADAKVNIVIRDNGIGIEPTIINKIFDPFFTTKTTGEASGVGLYLSHEIVQNHKGTISVKSEKDIYTEFIITLPIS